MKENNNSKYPINSPIIYTPGLNQLYFIDYNFLTYSSIESKIIGIINEKNNIINISKELNIILDNYNKGLILNYPEFKNVLFNKLNINLNVLLEYLDEWITKNVNYLHKNQLSFIKKINGNIYNDNPFYLLIDEICLSQYQIKNNLSFNFYTQKELLSNELKNVISKNKIFLYSYNPSILMKFKKNFAENIFTFLLNTYLFCFKDLIPNEEENRITNDIIKYFEEEKEKGNIYNKSPYIINSDINFLTTNIFAYENFYYEVINNNICTFQSLVDYLNKVNPKIVLVFTRFLTRKENFVKQRYFINGEDIIYKPHYGGVNKICNGKVDLVIAKSYELKDFEEYKNIFSFLENNYKMSNDIHNFKYFVDKSLQNKFLEYFCCLINKNEFLDKSVYKYKLHIIKGITLDLKQFKAKNDILNTLQKNNIQFPIILKYTSNNPSFKHQISIILNEKYLDIFNKNYIEKIYNEKYETTVLVQQITNHGGYVLKVYHMGNKNYIDYRSSLIDIDENNKDLINELFQDKGFWNFKTKIFESEEYRNNIWNKYSIKDGVEEKIKKDKNLYDYILNIVKLFEIYSHMGLFGIDILIGNDNRIYIIDANSLPGYKQGFEVEKDLRNYFKMNIENY